MKPVRVGVVGVGHLGKEHARIAASIEGATLAAVADVDGARARAIAEKHGAPWFKGHREVLGLVDAAIIAVPTVHHCAVAREFLSKRIPVLVEKPLAKTLQEAEELVSLSHENHTTLAVGHVERFNPAVQALSGKIVEPRFIECHRLAPFSFRSTDLDVVMDLMIHDIDIILHFTGSEVARVDATGVSVLGRGEDIANARIVFENGCVANVTASRVSDKEMRKIRFFSKDQYTSLDYQARHAVIYRPGPALQGKDPSSIAATPPKTLAERIAFMKSGLLSMEEFKFPADTEPLRLEDESFVRAVAAGTPPLVPGDHGLRAMRTADLILRAIRESALS
ncbi:MAG: Gfo/Idh/MocA family oxidoreductase [Planctomycetota bacterium]